MYLSDIADKIVEGIQASAPVSWPGGIVLPHVDFPVKNTLDPSADITQGEGKGIYIIPAYNEYDLTSKRQRGTGVSTIKRIVLCICSPFESGLEVNSGPDVAAKSEWSLLTNLREDLERFIINQTISGIELREIDPEPPDEEALNARIYLTSTVLGYRTCV